VFGILVLSLPRPLGVEIAVALQLFVYGLFRLTQHAGESANAPGRTQHLAVGTGALVLAVLIIVAASTSSGFGPAIHPLVAIFWVAAGIAEIIAARQRRSLPGSLLELLSGALAVAIGAMLYTGLATGATIGLLGAWLIVLGVLLVITGVRRARTPRQGA
jgi:uncharacterized membrane protein HdeD (DUF308 family)